MTVLADVLDVAGRPERISAPGEELFVTVKLNCGGAVQRVVKSGKVPVPFTGYRVRAGQFIYSRIDARNGAFAIVPEELHGAVVSKDFPVFDVRREQIDERYLVHFLRAGRLQEKIRAASFGATNRQRITEEHLLGFEIFLPPLDEQRRIAATLDQADAIRTKRRQTLALLDDLTQSVRNNMFGSVGSATGLKVVELADVVTGIDGGSSRPCLARSAAENEWGILKLGAVTYGEFREDENKAFIGDLEGMAANEVHAGDVLMTRKNTLDLVGAVAIVGEVRPRLLMPDLIFRLHLDDSRIDRRYFHAMMMSPAMRRAVRTLASGSAASMSNISKARLRKLPIALPTLEKQIEFGRRVDGIEERRTVTQRALAADDELFASLQSRAFRGEL